MVQRLNSWLALRITQTVGTMWTAYLFALLAIVGFPHDHPSARDVVAWLSQTFLQLTLLAVIMVGQDVQSQRSEERIQRLLTRVEQLEERILKEVSAICVKENIEI